MLNIFKELTQLERCSGNYEDFIEYTKNFAKENGYEVEIDKVKNIKVYKQEGSPQLILQSHYDIVCLGDCQKTELIEEENILKANNTTLGADNGIGCAYMFKIIEMGYDVELLFTSDEEIGLIGANNLELTFKGKYLLNLDSEEEGDVCVGCAGGVDLILNQQGFEKQIVEKPLFVNKVTISDLPGGHSGVDINKNIPNAIKEIVKIVKENNAYLYEINGGERRNSIPKKCTAKVVSEKPLEIVETSNIIVEQMQIYSGGYFYKLKEEVIDYLESVNHGVYELINENEVMTSSNLAIINTNKENNDVEIITTLRSMDNDKMKQFLNESEVLAKEKGFETKITDGYVAWEKNENEFTKKVFDIYKEYNENVKIGTIHAGLECAILNDKIPGVISTSIGPNIYLPHSNKEYTEKDSCERVFEILLKIVKEYT